MLAALDEAVTGNKDLVKAPVNYEGVSQGDVPSGAVLSPPSSMDYVCDT